MSKRNISLFKVNLPKDIHLALQSVLESGFVSEGPRSAEFQKSLQAWLGNPYVATVNSGTMALTLAYRMAGVGPGKECIISPQTCAASSEPILSLGGKVIWADIDPNTGNIDPEKLEGLITKNTVAISFTDWAGTPCELDAIIEIANKHGLKTVEDCAHSLGALYKGNKTGSTGTGVSYSCFSFQAIKHLTTLDGGAIACSNEDDYERATSLRWFGCKRNHNSSPVKWTGDITEYGYKGHMCDPSATIGLESLKTIDSVIEKHKYNGKLMTDLFWGAKNVKSLAVPDYIGSSYWIYTILLNGEKEREHLSRELDKVGIGNNIVHTPNHRYSLFKDSYRELPGVDEFAKRQICIPVGWWLEVEDIEFISNTVKEAVI